MRKLARKFVVAISFTLAFILITSNASSVVANAKTSDFISVVGRSQLLPVGNIPDGMTIIGTYMYNAGLDVSKFMTAARSTAIGQSNTIFVHEGEGYWVETISGKYYNPGELPFASFEITHNNWVQIDAGGLWSTVSIPKTIFNELMYDKVNSILTVTQGSYNLSTDAIAKTFFAGLINGDVFSVTNGVAKKETGGDVSKTPLSTAIELAEAIIKDVLTSTNGADIAKDKYWVTTAVMTTFNSAISSAKVVNSNADATQEAINTALTSISNATKVFASARKLGTKIDAVSVSGVTIANSISTKRNSQAFETLVATPSFTGGNGTVTYQWYASNSSTSTVSDTPLGTGSAQVISEAEFGKYIYCVVNGNGIETIGMQISDLVGPIVGTRDVYREESNYSVTLSYIPGINLTFVVVKVNTPVTNVEVDGNSAANQTDNLYWRYTLDGIVNLTNITINVY